MSATIKQVGESRDFDVAVTGRVTLRAEHVAQAFAAMSAEAQAGTFALIADIAQGWPENGAAKQWTFVGHALRKNHQPEAVAVLRAIVASYDGLESGK